MFRTPVLAVTAFALTGVIATSCARKNVIPAAPAPPPPPVAEAAPPPPPPPPPPAPVAPAPLTDDELFARKSLSDLNREAPLAHVFFDVDSADLRGGDRDLLQRNSGWLQRWPTTRVVIEGHGDSRGTPEYNLALGERRAHVVREYLVTLGVPADRVTIVSKGKEQPFCADEIESCWQQNRRGHFVISAK